MFCVLSVGPQREKSRLQRHMARQQRNAQRQKAMANKHAVQRAERAKREAASKALHAKRQAQAAEQDAKDRQQDMKLALNKEAEFKMAARWHKQQLSKFQTDLAKSIREAKDAQERANKTRQEMEKAELLAKTRKQRDALWRQKRLHLARLREKATKKHHKYIMHMHEQ